MSNEESNGNGAGDPNGEHPLKLAVDIADWRNAGQRILKVYARIERIVPPADGGEGAELAQLIARTDELFAELVEVRETIIRPRLRKYEGAPIPPLTFL